MKNLKVIGYGLWVIGMLLVSVPTMAQQDQWKTSSMQGSGSAYSSNVTAVGATSAASAATTTESSPARVSGPRRNNYNDLFDQGADTGQSDQSPIGDAVLPLSLMALAFAGYVALRRKRAAKS